MSQAFACWSASHPDLSRFRFEQNLQVIASCCFACLLAFTMHSSFLHGGHVSAASSILVHPANHAPLHGPPLSWVLRLSSKPMAPMSCCHLPNGLSHCARIPHASHWWEVQGLDDPRSHRKQTLLVHLSPLSASCCASVMSTEFITRHDFFDLVIIIKSTSHLPHLSLPKQKCGNRKPGMWFWKSHRHGNRHTRRISHTCPNFHLWNVVLEVPQTREPRHTRRI